MITNGFSQQQHPLRQLGPLGLVILLHIAFFYALQSGLNQHARRPEPKEIIATLIAAQPAPKAAAPAPQPEPPKPQVQPKPERPKPQPAPRPVKQTAKPEPAPEPTPNSINRPAEPSPTAAPAAPAAPAAAPAPATAATASAPAQPKTVTSGLEYISQPPREYPALSRRMGEEGTATLRILVNEKGRVEQAELRKSSGFPRLDEAARQWALRVVFKPYMENGRPIPVYATLPISFNLDS